MGEGSWIGLDVHAREYGGVVFPAVSQMVRVAW